MNLKKAILFLLVGSSILLTGCGSSDIEKKNEDDLESLISWMTGSFSNQEQAEADLDFFDVRLHTVQIWTERTDGKWLYVEQMMANSLDRPYRQVIYHMTQIDNSTFQITPYSFDNPLRFRGEWKEDVPMAQLTPDSLRTIEGCSIMLKRSGNKAFTGGTVGKDCADSFLGASYAICEVIITDTEMISWDRGYNPNDVQVWGSTTGGYIFKKIEDDQ